ncbi:tRNA (adenosine(37)-N6)-threonylcarbamoyltransferase complex dimerization subunit type 1 TsaB [Pedobacter changchengzhani]|uniref:tRNA (Adenosine(37)-N6)-threonylcarbamoyltransferase complex dimerization subunit type 1 TsaB n=1 Tax=Pedobacter changchengzhani TaxID=2529274 RepID=A0A4V3A014_9SPHI|nr:tRNA (adenosine(37)-N6)-threonylcarbamoyltransferase complex dimerization subunit type 1 TsaB [Pedobacter changchengzhani]TDG35863.1 tRNA (adenosine(37)-N6)-threonylcarbamoyltransferase complex dimerization subunit type 1 TsaB [Pedobacter changchengzhani]
MAKILLIETATKVCSVALSVDGNVVALKEESGQSLHASNLTLFIDEVIKNSLLEYKDLDAVCVSKGPGSYTGLRIGVSSAKGICFALDIPLIAIETLLMMAAGFLEQHTDYKGLVTPMIDARRMEVYTSVFDAKLNVLEPTSAKIIDAESYSNFLTASELTFIGDGAEKCAITLNHSNSKFNLDNFNSATNMSKLAESAFHNNKFEDVAYFEPFYLKDFVVTQPKAKLV